MAEILIPPWVRPESPETLRIIDDATVAFAPAFGRGTTQRGIFADPRWGLHRRYRGLRSDERAAILIALNETRGQFNILRLTPHAPLRGSFATSELIGNNSFASGVSAWGNPTDARSSYSVSDRVARIQLLTSSPFPYIWQQITGLTQYAPYVFRWFGRQGRFGTAAVPSAQVGTSEAAFDYGSVDATDYGFATNAFVTIGTSAHVHALLRASPVTGMVAGDYYLAPYTSLARCALVDNGVNYLLQSDAVENASWTVSNGSTVTTGITAPDSSTSARRIVETATTGSHNRGQAITVTSSVQDICVTGAIKKDTRGFGYVSLEEATGVTRTDAILDFSNGNITVGTGANWSNARAISYSLGNGWFYISLVARKTNSATSIRIYVGPTISTAGIGYSGSTSEGMYAWRITASPSSVPIRQVATTSSALTTGTDQTGGACYTKGWPASTSGLLLAGDWFAINGELKQLTAPVNSDAAGLAYMQFRPGLAGAPADNDAVVVQEPFGRFIYPQGTRELSNMFGTYADCEMDLEEIYS